MSCCSRSFRPHGAANDAAVLARLIGWIYGLGIAPDWWKLAGPPGDDGWAMVSEAVGANDSNCRGILLLGLDAPESEMMAALAVAARQPACKGFAIGRTIFGAAAEAWMNGTIDDEQARASVADAYRRMIEGWRRAREGVQAMSTVRLTMAQAIVKFLAAQQVEIGGRLMPLFGGVFAIFGHGNVAGLGEALAAARDILPTYRAHNEQAMAHAAIAFAKTMNRRRMMACTTLDRAGRHQYGDGGGGGACQPAAPPAAPGRHLRQPAARSGAAADRGGRRSDHHRQ